MSRKKLLYICDWLPPDFGAVGQYSLHFARERARGGEDVVLAGLSSEGNSTEREDFDEGSLTIVRFKAKTYDRSRFAGRLVWTIKTNLKLLWGARRELRWADEILFTGSPPFMLQFTAPLNWLLRKQLTYRITDFHPECLMASLERVPLWLGVFHRLTIALRRTVDRFEVLGDDQRRRLEEIGISGQRIVLKRDISPVSFHPKLAPLPRPAELNGHVILLYSGNFGVAHESDTFIEAYKLHHGQGSGRVALWLNAIGTAADAVEQAIREAELPILRSRPVPLDQLNRLLITPDAHLITLRDSFVGFVLPSKVYGCIDSGRDVMYIGSRESDIYALCKDQLVQGGFHQAGVGQVERVASALEDLADRAEQRAQQCEGAGDRSCAGARSLKTEHIA